MKEIPFIIYILNDIMNQVSCGHSIVSPEETYCVLNGTFLSCDTLCSHITESDNHHITIFYLSMSILCSITCIFLIYACILCFIDGKQNRKKQHMSIQTDIPELTHYSIVIEPDNSIVFGV